jgi:murein DD-endopeptidase MepM/ murein hydrolase activator NlpD
MGRNRGSAARGRGRTRAYAVFGPAIARLAGSHAIALARSHSVAGAARFAGAVRAARVAGPGATARAVAAAGLATVALAPAASAQSTGGATPVPAPKLSAPPPGVVVRPAPDLRSWRCVRTCQDAATAYTGSLVRVRGRVLGRTYEVVFLGAAGEADDVAAAPLRRKRNVVDVRVPLGAAPGPILLANHDGLQSQPSAAAVKIAPPATLKVAGAAPTVEVQAQARRAFFDAARPAKVSYVVHGDSAARVAIELVRAGDGVVVTTWDAGQVAPETPQTLAWDGTVGGKLQKQGRYSFRVSAVDAAGVQAVSAQSAEPAPDPAQIQFLQHEFPVRGPHYFGEFAARFGGGRGHQGQDVFAACGTPLVAARGGVVKFKQYHSRAGHYLVIDGEQTAIDYAYMHLRSAALVEEGDRVRTGQPIGYVGQTGRASGCHLHLEMWSGPGWYDGGQPFDPLPSLLEWDRAS